MTEQVETQVAQDAQVQATANGAENSAPAAPDLTISDLQALRTIIDVCTQRGSFRANEMASVGQVYNRLNAFLDHVAPQKETTEKTKE
jgi:hypothetical protein